MESPSTTWTRLSRSSPSSAWSWKLELTKYHTPAAAGAEPENPPPNTLGLHRGMFAVDDIFRLCYLRGPAGIIVALAEQIAADTILSRGRPSGSGRRRKQNPTPPKL